MMECIFLDLRYNIEIRNVNCAINWTCLVKANYVGRNCKIDKIRLRIAFRRVIQLGATVYPVAH